jgi:hypothetical protein
MSLHVERAGCIRNRDLHAAPGRAREKLEKIINDAHFAAGVARNAERQLDALNGRTVNPDSGRP